MKLILLNGPPRSGKDFAGLKLQLGSPNVKLFKMSKELKERCHAAYLLFGTDGRPLRHDWFESVKDEPREEFEGLTPREAYIAFSENWLKPTHGTGKLGEWLAEDILHWKTILGDFTAVVTDCGFLHEVVPLVGEFGAENILLIRLHRVGYTFEGDSRSHIDLSHMGVPCMDIDNTGEEFAENICKLSKIC